VSIRRTLQYLKKSLVDGTRFAVFEPNNSDLWDRLSAVITQFLTTAMQIGVIKGNSQQEAFYVKVDAENNTPVSVSNGEVHIEVGVALNTPAEFIVIKIGQFEGGTDTTDSTATV
jgi:phage tail sheath protein FI